MENSHAENVAPNVYAAVCPSREVLALIGEKWVSLVIGALDQRVLRFGELKRICEGVSQKMLTQTLRKLERDGLVCRQAYSDELVMRVEYRLSELGQTLVPVVAAMKLWAEANLKAIEQSRLEYGGGA
ncbi:helix-turn-helix transcriptional regulator [Thalassomonas viridans]|uniref:Helix-turn-helix transcriptional regulator n=1 Tax=Thalassomonas viridans TaxID=137584 RepID=A0AAF0CE11_9GAMM|nr:helix-turn-helix domain-containing protein [Thalassomonas viridans]WDE08474.1 helix-turn-helix transcriptional regulator [Thalassomonas viridans]